MTLKRLTLPLLFLTLTALALVTHSRAFGLFYVQDDAYAWLSSDQWLEMYKTITTALQYRPNSFLVTHLLDLVFPDKPWPLKLAGMAVLLAIALLTLVTVKRLGKGRTDRIAVFTALLLVVHPGYYSLMNLYLSASMTGLGLLCVLWAAIAARYRAHAFSLSAYAMTFLAFLGGLTSYEAAIIALPLMMLIDLLYRPAWTHVKPPLFFTECACTIKRYALHIGLCLVYLYLRMLGIHAASVAGQSAGYAISPSAAAGNIYFQIQNLFAYPYISASMYIPTAKFWPFLLAPIGWAAWIYASRHNVRKLWMVAVAWLVLGLAPFVLVTVNGHCLHYVYYALPGFAMLIALMLGWVSDRSRLAALILAALLMASCIYLNHQAYKKHILNAMAYSGLNIAEEFEKTKPSSSDIVMLNINDMLAWRVYFGDSINIIHRAHPFRFAFPQDGAKTMPVPDGFSKEPAYLYADYISSDTEFMNARLRDVTKFVHPKAQWQDIPLTLTTNKGRSGAVLKQQAKGIVTITALEDLDSLTLSWTPKNDHMPLTVQYAAQSNIPSAPIIESVWHTPLGKEARCFMQDDGPPYTLALPPLLWKPSDHISLVWYGIKKGMRFTVTQAQYKHSFTLPEGEHMQFCSESIFP